MLLTKSLKSRSEKLAEPVHQLEVIGKTNDPEKTFAAQLRKSSLFPLQPTSLEIFQINVGKMCNQVCKHCHVDAGPDRKEIMTRETMQQCIAAARDSGAHTIDITGGAPEMNPDFRSPWIPTAESSWVGIARPLPETNSSSSGVITQTE